jgi:hypothetical protein
MRAKIPALALRRFAAFLVAVACAFVAAGQDDILNVAGLVTDEADRKKLAGVEVSVTRDGAPFDALTTDAKGAYDFQLPLRHDYVFSFTYPGYGVKRIRVDGSKVPPEDLKGGFRLDMPMSLFKLVDGFNPAILEDYYGKASFDPVKNTIAFDFSHTERMRNKVKAEFDRVARMAGDLAKMREDFAALLAKGKSAMTASKWDQALTDFTAALAIFPDDKEALQLQAQAQAKVDEQQSAAQAEKKFQDALKAAEADLKADKLDSAAERFRGAQALKPAAPEPADGLKRVEARRTALAADENYRKAIADADAHFTAGRYADASKGYAAASTMKPAEVYPKTRKADADRLLADAAAQAAALAEKTARYETLVAAADKAFKAKSFKEAKASYEEAARVLPAEKYPPERIALCVAEIDKENAAAAAAASASASAAAAAAAAAELDAKYTAQISAGDAAFAKSDWAAAKAAYRKALELKPAESYPTSRLDRISKEEKAAASAADAASAAAAKKAADEEAARLAAERKAADAAAKEAERMRLEEERARKAAAEATDAAARKAAEEEAARLAAERKAAEAAAKKAAEDEAARLAAERKAADAAAKAADAAAAAAAKKAADEEAARLAAERKAAEAAARAADAAAAAAAKKAADEEAARLAAERKAADAAAKASEKERAEQERIRAEEERARLAAQREADAAAAAAAAASAKQAADEEAARLAAERKASDAAAKEAERQRIEQDRLRAEEERARLAAQREADEIAAAAARKQADEEAARLAAERKAADAAAKEAERLRLEEERVRLAAEKEATAAARKAAAEEEARLAEQRRADAEAERKRLEAEQARLAEERAAELAAKKIEEEEALARLKEEEAARAAERAEARRLREEEARKRAELLAGRSVATTQDEAEQYYADARTSAERARDEEVLKRKQEVYELEGAWSMGANNRQEKTQTALDATRKQQMQLETTGAALQQNRDQELTQQRAIFEENDRTAAEVGEASVQRGARRVEAVREANSRVGEGLGQQYQSNFAALNRMRQLFQSQEQRASNEQNTRTQAAFKESSKGIRGFFAFGKDHGERIAQNQAEIERLKQEHAEWLASRAAAAERAAYEERMRLGELAVVEMHEPVEILDPTLFGTPEGVSEQSYDIQNGLVIERTVRKGNKIRKFRKVVTKSGVYYFEGERSITQETWQRETELIDP